MIGGYTEVLGRKASKISLNTVPKLGWMNSESLICKRNKPARRSLTSRMVLVRYWGLSLDQAYKQSVGSTFWVVFLEMLSNALSDLKERRLQQADLALIILRFLMIALEGSQKFCSKVASLLL